MQDPPEDVRGREVRADPKLQPEEKELRIICPNDMEECLVATEIPTTIKWVLSVEEATVEGVRLGSEGAIMGIKAHIPRGYLMLKGSNRKSQRMSQMVSYGPTRR